MKQPSRRGRFLGILIIIAAVVVAALLVLVALGILALPQSSKPTLTVLGGGRWFVQGTNSAGGGWFGPSYINFSKTALGFPINVTVGGSFTLAIAISNFDTSPHELYSATTNSPFSVDGTSPTLPWPIPAGQDNGIFRFTIGVPNTPGAQLWLNLTINAIPP